MTDRRIINAIKRAQKTSDTTTAVHHNDVNASNIWKQLKFKISISELNARLTILAKTGKINRFMADTLRYYV